MILDELNLAPTDVLEALNRLLDDNRELFIPETQETVKAHSMFMLFATQNPPGSYGGRKVLSRAFRNRFVEIHFDEIPSAELEVILHMDWMELHRVAAWILLNHISEVIVKHLAGRLAQLVHTLVASFLMWRSLMHKHSNSQPASPW